MAIDNPRPDLSPDQKPAQDQKSTHEKSTHERRSARAQQNKLLLFGVGAILLLGIGLYWGGLARGRGQITAQKTEYEQRIQTMQTELDSARAQLTTAQNHGLLMQARAALYRTAVDLDYRNFGTANKHLQEAASVLDKLDQSDGQLNSQRITQLHTSIAETNINVATDLEGQREQVLNFATQLNALMPSTP